MLVTDWLIPNKRVLIRKGKDQNFWVGKTGTFLEKEKDGDRFLILLDNADSPLYFYEDEISLLEVLI